MEQISTENIMIGKIPALLWGEPSENIFLYIHGKMGYKEEAERLAQIVCPKRWQVLSFDLPEHGERGNETNAFNPWTVVPELEAVYQFAVKNRNRICLYANSLGAWFSMLALEDKPIEHCLFVSPVLDMQKLIENMMKWAGVNAGELESEQEISTDFGETLSWKYYCYAKAHPIEKWEHPTSILYAGNDNLTQRQTVNDFVDKFHCDLTVMEEGEHWFHTEEQLDFLRGWIKEKI